MGIEPTSEAWEASILPLYDARSRLCCRQLYTIAIRCEKFQHAREKGASRLSTMAVRTSPLHLEDEALGFALSASQQADLSICHSFVSFASDRSTGRSVVLNILSP
jgi:hypothetical protein